MGHRAEDLLPELKRGLRVRSEDDERRLLAFYRQAAAESERLAGRHFNGTEEVSFDILPGGLPFVDVPDMQIGSVEPESGIGWFIPDPNSPGIATVLQLVEPLRLTPDAGPLSGALAVAAEMIAPLLRNHRLRDEIWHWLGLLRPDERAELIARAADAAARVHVPIITKQSEGWWIQVSRRLFTSHAGSTGELDRVEALADMGEWGLLATEPRVIIARLTEHPVEKVMSIRMRFVDGEQASGTWRTRKGPRAIRRHGLPTVSVDERTTQAELAAQFLLTAELHGDLEHEDHLIPPALVRAFPTEVASIKVGTGTPGGTDAAILLFGRLAARGFDPSCSAEAMRHYVRSHARSIVREHRAAERQDRPWSLLGIDEGYYYKLLRARGVPKGADARYDVEPQALVEVRDALEGRAIARDRRRAALDVLRHRGFSEAAARKWLQRHPLEAVFEARPRGQVG